MSFRIKNGTNLQRTRIQMNSVTNLLPCNRVPVPQENIERRMIPHSQGQHRHTRTNSTPFLSNSNKMFQTYKSHEEFRSTVIGELRKTWQPRIEEAPLRATGRMSSNPKKYKSQQMKKTWRESSSSSRLWAPKIFVPPHWNESKKSENLNHPEDFFQSEPSKPPQKFQYLKKGTNINRKVVTNLLKLKLLKNNREEEDDERERINTNKFKNTEILDLIKIYKGYGQADLEFLKSDMEKHKKLEKSGQKGKKLNHEEDYDSESEKSRGNNPLTNMQLMENHPIEGWKQPLDASVNHQMYRTPVQSALSAEAEEKDQS